MTSRRVVSLRYMTPIFADVFAVLFLKENIKPMQWLFFIISFLGVMILKNFDEHLNVFGLILVLITAIFSALVTLSLVKLELETILL